MGGSKVRRVNELNFEAGTERESGINLHLKESGVADEHGANRLLIMAITTVGKSMPISNLWYWKWDEANSARFGG